MTQPIQGAGQIGARFPIQQRPVGPIGQNFDSGEASSFKDTLANALGEVQGMQDDASDAIEAFLRGDPVELHDVMAAVEEAGLALEMLIEVRNRVINAYRTVVNMQT